MTPDSEATAALPPEIAAETLAAWRADGKAHAVLDVREPWEVDVAALAGAITVPMGEVPARLEEFPRDVPLVILCHHGARSFRVMSWLRGRGMANAVNLAGGIDAWSREVDPSVPTY
ncbi:rhodanese-like domain-containing protein [Elioraea sp.]|uniref:rhodanese-like domain-containing protein n=1 Tax=Elioraea sp. TaxID=2185103 RepID=UPI0025BD53C1|nr:rhodanese-like domain-containing protein [Elioraea sp.]